MEVCSGCGQLQGIEAYDEQLWNVYDRIEDGRSNRDALVFDGEFLSEHVHDEEDFASVNLAMERDMHSRGLCIACGRPNLSGVDPASILSETDAREMAEMYAEQAAERRMGC